MRKCLYCKIEVGGDLAKCPICQSKLVGEPEEAYFPKQEEGQRRSLYYKIQLYIVWVLIITGLSLDFLFHLSIPIYPDLHWSLLLTMWLVAFEFLIMRQFRPGTGSARKDYEKEVTFSSPCRRNGSCTRSLRKHHHR